MEIGQWLVIGLSLFIGGVFLAGHYYNRRLVSIILPWVKGGLSALGDTGVNHWKGTPTSGASLTSTQVDKPLKRVEIEYHLEARENLPLWLYQRARNQKDNLLLAVTLRKAPLVTGYATWAHSRRHGDQSPTKGNLDPRLDEILQQLRAASQLSEIRVEQNSPHLKLYLIPRRLNAGSADRFFRNIYVLAEQVIHEA